MPRLLVAVMIGLVAGSVGADPISAVGTWRGHSLCTVKPSACHDEVIVYHFARGPRADALVLTANKIVGGEEGTMGVLDCTVGEGGRGITCPIEKGVFRYRIEGRTLTGTLTLTNGQVFRRIDATRAD
jgi:hypothetical protein